MDNHPRHPPPVTAAPVTAASVIRTALPIASLYLTEMLVGLTDLAVVGMLGTEALAAVGLGKTVLLSFLTIGFAILSAGTVFMAERPTPRRSGTIALACLAVAVGFALAAIGIGAGAPAVLAWGGYDRPMVALFESYTTVLVWALFPALVLATYKNVLNAANRTGIMVWLSVAIVFGNAVASILLVHGIGGWSGLGVAGAAWATLAVNALAAGFLAGWSHRRGLVRFAVPPARRLVAWVKAIIRLGWAAGAQQTLESVLFVAVLYLLGTHSAAWLAAGTVAFAVMEPNFALSGALGEVLTARLAAFRAARRFADLRHGLFLGAGLSAAAAATLAVPVALFPGAVAAIFSGPATPPDAHALLRDVLRWTAPFLICDALQILFVHAMRGLKQTVRPMLVSTACYWVIGLGGGLVLAEGIGLGAPGIWIGFCAGLAAAALALAAMAAGAVVRPPQP